jgi:hypothetical protein
MKKNTEKNTKAEEITEELLENEIVKEIIGEEKEKIEIIKKLEEEDKVPVTSEARRGRRGEKTREEIIAGWEPKTHLGKEVKSGKIKNIDEILDNKRKILEPEITDFLLNLKSDLLAIG